MERTIISRLAVILCCCSISVLSLRGADFTVDGVEYDIYWNNKTSVEVVGLASPVKADYTIPDSVSWEGEDYKVNAIGGNAFKLDPIERITLSEGIGYIGSAAFYYCSSLKEVNLPSSLTEIGNEAFSNCVSLESIVLPESLTYCGYEAFIKCVSLESIILPESLTSYGNSLFKYCYSLKSVEIKAPLTQLNGSTFYECTSLEQVTLPQTIGLIKDRAFYACSALKEIELPSSLHTIESSAFLGCKLLHEVELPSTVTEIGYEAFNSYGIGVVHVGSTTPPDIKSDSFYSPIVYVPANTLEAYKADPLWSKYVLLEEGTKREVKVTLTEAGTLAEELTKQPILISELTHLVVSGPMNAADVAHLDAYGDNLMNLDLRHTTLTSLSDRAFNDNDALRTLYLPSTLSKIGERAFFSANCLVSVYFEQDYKSYPLGSALEVIGEEAFYGCYAMRDISLPKGLNEIHPYAFYYCYSIPEVTIPGGVEVISHNAFNDCEGLKKIVIEEGCRLIGESAFSGTHRLEELVLPSSLEKIYRNAFSYTGLETLVIPENVHEIDYRAFYNSDLKVIDLPESLKCCNLAFAECERVEKITIRAATPPDLANYFLGDSYELEPEVELWVPSWSKGNYLVARGWEHFTNIHAFADDPSLVVISSPLFLAENARFGNKPAMRLDDRGELTVRGSATLSLSSYQQSLSHIYDYYSNDEEDHTVLINEADVMRADEVSIVLQVEDRAWNFVALPFDVAVSDITTSNGSRYVISRYDCDKRANPDGTSSWVDLGADETLKANVGYIINAEQECYITFKATDNENKNRMFANKSIAVALEEHPSAYAQNMNWNFVGNPFPSNFDMSKTNLTTPYIVMEDNNYVAYSPKDDDYIALVLGSFFLQKPADQSEIIFYADGRQASTKKKAAQAELRAQPAGDEREVYNLTLSDGTTSDRTRIVLNPRAAAEYELACDASKFMSDNAAIPQIYSLDDNKVKYAINEGPYGEETIIPLELRLGGDEIFTVSLEAEGDHEVILVDQLEGIETNLSEQAYSFAAKVGVMSGRFFVKFKRQYVTGVDEATDDAEVLVVVVNGGVRIEAAEGSQIAIYSSLGQMVVSESSTSRVNSYILEPGAYMIWVNGESFKRVVY